MNPGLFASCFQSHQIPSLDLDFGRIFDEDNALLRRNEAGKRIKKRSLAGTSAAGYEKILTTLDSLAEPLGNMRR